MDLKEFEDVLAKDIFDYEFCDECSFLSPNEQEQKKGEAHMCLKLQKRLLHKAQHPHIPRPKDCPLRKAEERRK